MVITGGHIVIRFVYIYIYIIVYVYIFKLYYYMASICFDESRNLIYWLLTGQDFPVLPTGNSNALRGCDESEDVSDDQKMLKSCLKSSKRRKKTPKYGKGLKNK